MSEMTKKEKKQWLEWLELCKRIRSDTAPFINETEKAKAKRIAKLLQPENHEAFCDYYFPHYKQSEFAWFHNEANDAILIDHDPFIVCEWSREFAKSVSVDVFITIKKRATGWLTGLILASETEGKAKTLLGDIEAELRNNLRFINDFGEQNIIGSWMQGSFSTSDGVGFWAFGVGQNPSGTRKGANRPNLGIIDDADSKKRAKNQSLTLETLDWCLGEFMGCLSTLDHQFIYLNNRVAKDGLTAHIVGDVEEGDPKREGITHIKAFFTEDPLTHEMLLIEQGGVPAWKRYSIEVCKAKISEMGFRNAMRQLYHMDIPQGKIFNDDNLPWVKTYPLHEYDQLVSYCDPAFGESDKGCFKAVVLLGKKGKFIHILWAWVRQSGNFVAAHYNLSEAIKEKSPVFISDNGKAGFRLANCQHWVESNELQKKILKILYEEENDLRGSAWFPKFDMDKKADKIGRIESMEPFAEHGYLGFNEAMKKDKDMQALRSQFFGFPDGFIDGPDAVEGGITKLNKKLKKSDFKNRSGKYKRSTARMG